MHHVAIFTQKNIRFFWSDISSSQAVSDMEGTEQPFHALSLVAFAYVPLA